MNTTLVVVGVPDSTATAECFDAYPGPKCPHAGMDAQLLYHILFHAGFHIHWLKVDNYTEAGELLRNGLADVYASMETPDGSLLPPEIVQNLTQLFILPGDKAFFVYRKRDLSVFQHVILSGGFKLPVWALIAAAGALCYTLVVSFKVIYRPRVKRFRDLESLLLSWGIVTNIILNAYGNLLTIALYTKPINTYHPFKSLPELAQKLIDGECRLMATEYVMKMFPVLFPKFNNYTATDEVDGDIAQLFKLAEEVNPPTVAPLNGTLKDYAEILRDRQNLYPQCFIMVTFSDEGYYFMWQSNGDFSAHIDSSIFTEPYFYFYSGHSKEVRDRIVNAMASDSKIYLRDRILRDFYDLQDSKSDSKTSELSDQDLEELVHERPVKLSEGLPLCLTQTIDAFYLFLGGNALAILVVFVEGLLFYKGLRR